MNASVGKLYLAASHLGDLHDIPERTLAICREAHLLIFEEDRPARQVLKKAGVQRAYEKLSEHLEKSTLDAAEKCLLAGETVGYIPDQGTPGVADPGRELVKLAYRIGADVHVVPGPCSIISALSVCTFYKDRFYFAGFLPRETPLRQKELRKLSSFDCPVVILDTPYRLLALLDDATKVLGPQHLAMLALNISCEDEKYWHAPLAQLVKKTTSLLETSESKPNFVLVLDRSINLFKGPSG